MCEAQGKYITFQLLFSKRNRNIKIIVQSSTDVRVIRWEPYAPLFYSFGSYPLLTFKSRVSDRNCDTQRLTWFPPDDPFSSADDLTNILPHVY